MLAGSSLVSMAQNQAQTPPASPNAPAPQSNEQQMAQRKEQMEKRAQQNAEHESKDMQTQLGLTEEQYKKVLQVNVDFNKKMMAPMMSPGSKPPTPEERSKNFEERENKFKAILKPEQLTKWKTTHPTPPSHNQPMPHPGQPNGQQPAPQNAPANK